MRWVAFFFLPLYACTSGSDSNPATLQLVHTNLLNGQTRQVNQPLEFTFDRPIDLETASLASIQFDPPTVQGDFYLASPETLIFQPLCPDSTNPEFGLQPGTETLTREYRITLLSGSQGIRAMDESSLSRTLVFQFQTPTPPQPAVVDLLPSSPPLPIRTEELPEVLPLNLFVNPIQPLEIHLDQPLDPESVNEETVKLAFGEAIPIPTTVILSKNCTRENGATLTVLPYGILPADQEILFTLNKELQGLGGVADRNEEDIPFHTAVVSSKADPQQDALLETFDTQGRMDPNPKILQPLATWKDGKLQAVPQFPIPNLSYDIEIGPGTTNGELVAFDTEGGTLKDTQGNVHFFPDGVIPCRRFFVLNPQGSNSQLEVFGDNPLVIQATKKIFIASSARISVRGAEGTNVTGVGTANAPAQGGQGRAGGGNGGTGSPRTDRSSAKGEDGNGPGQVPGGGGEGGHSAYANRGSFNPLRPGGGGGGHWGTLELNRNAEYIEWCWGTSRRHEGQGEECRNNEGACASGQPFNNAGEHGSNGTQCNGVRNPICQLRNNISCPTEEDCQICHRDAVTGRCWAKGGQRALPVFTDADPQNNFFGRKPLLENEELVLLPGELEAPRGGQGGGGGGDGVRWGQFPNFPPRFPASDIKGGGGGGGGGVLLLQAQNEIDIRGFLTVQGGAGGRGEEFIIDKVGAGGGGGGSGGMIIIEAPRVKIASFAFLNSRGGNRSLAGGTLPGWPRNSGGNKCKLYETSSKGGAGGMGVILFRLPFEEDETITCGGATSPAIKDGALQILKFPGPQVINIRHERQMSPANTTPGYPAFVRNFSDPAPQVVLPTFGSHSAAQSQWHFLGWPASTWEWSHRGTDSEGWVDPAFSRTLASGSSFRLLDPHTVALDSPELANLAAPGVLRGDAFLSFPGGNSRNIVEASRDDDSFILRLEEPFLADPGPWEVQQIFQASLLDGQALQHLPESARIRIEFEGAQPLEPGSRLADPATLSGPRPDLQSLSGFQLLRFRVSFESNALGEDTSARSLPLPGLRLLKFGLSF